MFELKPLVCKNCGGLIDRKTMQCPYCGTQYKHEYEETVIRFVPERPGVHRLGACVELPDELSVKDPEAATKYAMNRLRQGIADGLLEYLKLETEYNPYKRTQIIRGEVRVIDPTFSEWGC